MKFLLPGFLIAALAITPVMAQEKNLKDVPEPLLVEGMNTIAVCMITDAVAITTLSTLAEDAETSDLKEIKKQANDLMESIVLESQFGNQIMTVLVDKYNHTNAELGKSLEDLSTTTRKELTEKVKDVSSYNDFKEIYGSRLWSCNQALNSWFKKITGRSLENKD